ncbi:MAG: L-aspartate oxidase [Vicinamibacterales bacterium]
MKLRADYVIVGSGIAALRAAIGLQDAGDVLVLTKAGSSDSNTDYAQGGIAAALGVDDSPARHTADTLAAGDGLCDPAAVEILTHEGTRYVRELIEWGARFDRAADGTLSFAREAAHAVRRVLHAKDATGHEIARTLWHRLSETGRPRILEHATAIDALVEDGACAGVTFLDRAGTLCEVRATTTLLATGGAGRLYRYTTNPSVATGDGIGLAFRAGGRVADLEFVQFHPTALDVPGQPPFLLSEALRGEGARLLNRAGEAFMPRYDSAAELAPRDRVARAIAQEAERTGGPIHLSLAHLRAPWLHERFPGISHACRRAGLDLATDPIPVKPAAHYVMGGVVTDLDGRTTVRGLFAAGEVACTGVHGANRLASNSLLEGLVFGARAAHAMQRYNARPGDWPGFTPTELTSGPVPSTPGTLDAESIRELMWSHVGLQRTRARLVAALARLADDGGRTEELEIHRRLERANLRLAGWLMARAALRREESRGAHFRDDFPLRDDDRWSRHVGDQCSTPFTLR